MNRTRLRRARLYRRLEFPLIALIPVLAFLLAPMVCNSILDVYRGMIARSVNQQSGKQPPRPLGPYFTW